MKQFSIYRVSDGMFTGQVRSIPDSRQFDATTLREGLAVIAGKYDHLSMRVDLANGQIIDYQPPQPDEDHEWIHDDESGSRVRRWVLKQDVMVLRVRRADALAEIESLEKLQLRSISELYADPSSRAARENFDRRKARIDELRASLSGETGTT